MRPVRIVLVVIALIAVGLAGWALGARGGYGQPGADPSIAEAPPAAPDDGVGDEAPKPPAEPPVRKAPKPVIESVSTVPRAEHIGGFLHLPPGPGQVAFRIGISNATRAQFWLAPTGTGVSDQAVWLGEDRNGRDGWTTSLRYSSQSLSAHLIIRATGPGGTAEEFVGVTNNGGGDELTEEGTQEVTEDQKASEDQKP